MGHDLALSEIVLWVSLMFPSVTQYFKIAIPAIMLVLSILGIFYDILPQPGSRYPVPTKTDLEFVLKDKNRLVRFVVYFSRKLTIIVNMFVGTKLYSGFYKVTRGGAKLLSIAKGKKLAEEDLEISEPTHYKLDLKWKRRDKKD